MSIMNTESLVSRLFFFGSGRLILVQKLCLEHILGIEC